jgi:hypothetical protein
MRLFSKPSFGDLRSKTSLHGSAAREHRRVLASRLPTPGASVTSPLHAPREVLFEMRQRRVLLASIQGEVRQVQCCPFPFITTIEGSLEPLCRLTHPMMIILFIVLTETKFSFRCKPVGIGTLLTGLGLKKKTHVMMLSP